ncbi:hypothetical protein KSX_20350 [Ktedonospora formicarum]|uniref:Uncharacterized protein n=1 Tax=Ktedonospora formicarum TaxID=2778364 RepID=A0A8J3MPJ1_9CHLR|nr:hypothetical protein KSX_20350 [Ktedonospora formicarum]
MWLSATILTTHYPYKDAKAGMHDIYYQHNYSGISCDTQALRGIRGMDSEYSIQTNQRGWQAMYN